MKKQKPERAVVLFGVKRMYDIAIGFSKSLAVEQIQTVISNGTLQPRELIEELDLDPSVVFSAFAKSKGTFLDKRSEERKKFDESIGPIFKNEGYFESTYDLGCSTEYQYQPASEAYVSLFYLLYKHLSGKSYKNSKELVSALHSAVKGKRILELGCGPGFALRVLKGLGAQVAGVEILDAYRESTRDINVHYGDAASIGEIFGMERFDIIISRDFFSNRILSKTNALIIAMAARLQTKRGGLGIHQLLYERVDPEVFDFHAWLQCRQTGKDYESYMRFLAGIPEQQKKERLLTNPPALEKRDFESMGFKIVDYSNKDLYLNIVLKNAG